MTEAETQMVIDLFNVGKTDDQIAESVHYSVRHILRVRHKMGMLRKRGRPPISEEKIRRMKDLRRQGVSKQCIARTLHRSVMTINRYMECEEYK